MVGQPVAGRPVVGQPGIDPVTGALTPGLALGLALVLSVVLPGLAGGALLSPPFSAGGPDRSRPGRFLGQALACGVGAWLLASGLLAELHVLSARTSWIASGVLGAVSLAVLALPRSRTALRSATSDLGHFAVLTVAAVLSWSPVLLLVLRTNWGPLESTPWYYWNLAEQVVDAGGIPARSLEWGTTTSFLDDYHLFSTGTAMLLTQVPADHTLVIRVITVLAVLVVAVSSVLLAMALGAGRLPALAAVPFTVASGVGAARLVAYRPEGFALGLELLLVALFIDWLRSAHWGSLGAAVILAPVLTQVHGIAVVCSAVLIVASMVALVTGPDRRSIWRRHLRRCVVGGAAMGAGILLLGLAFGGASGTVHAGHLPDQGGLEDPTWEFYRAARGDESSLPPGNAELVGDAFVRLYYLTWWWWVVPVLLLAAAVLVRAAWGTSENPERARTARTALVFTGLSLAGLTALAAVFALGWDSYVPRRTGAQRVVIESTLLLGPLVAWALSAALTVGDPAVVPSRSRWLPARRASAAAVAVLCLAAVGASVRVAGAEGEYRPSRGDFEALAGLGITESDVVLTNVYLEGYLAQVTGTSAGLLEGRAPYTFAGLQHRATRLLRGAQAFYADPRGHWDYLVRQHVTYVLVSRRGSYSLGTRNIFHERVRRRVLNRCTGLRQVLETPDLSVYRVQTSGQAGRSGCPTKRSVSASGTP